jgi:biotin carboxyl carrier protein
MSDREKDKIHVDGTDYPTELTEKYRKKAGWKRPDPRKLTAVIPGTIVEVMAKPGQKLDWGAPLLVLEAMKMRNEVVSPRKGLVVAAVHVSPGDVVMKGQLLVEFE